MKGSNTKQLAAYTALKADILDGRYAKTAFPSERGLAARFRVSRSTMTRVLADLEREGLVVRRQGSGTFVSRQGASRRIGLIVPSFADSEFFPPIVSEINRLARESGYALRFGEVCSGDDRGRCAEVRALADEFLCKRVSGVIYEPLSGAEGAAVNRHVLDAFDQAGVPTVLLDCDIVPFPFRSGYDVVGVNDVEAGAKLVGHLLSVGARRIHILRCAFCPTTFENRIYGAEAALRKAGLFRPGAILRAEPDDLAALKRHLRRGRPDAFICGNDSIAAAFRQTLARTGLSVPEDILLAGFGDLRIAKFVSPTLTTIRQSCELIARVAFRRLLARIADPDLPVAAISLPAPLVERESTRGFQPKTPKTKGKRT